MSIMDPKVNEAYDWMNECAFSSRSDVCIFRSLALERSIL